MAPLHIRYDSGTGHAGRTMVGSKDTLVRSKKQSPSHSQARYLNSITEYENRIKN